MSAEYPSHKGFVGAAGARRSATNLDHVGKLAKLGPGLRLSVRPVNLPLGRLAVPKTLESHSPPLSIGDAPEQFKSRYAQTILFS